MTTRIDSVPTGAPLHATVSRNASDNRSAREVHSSLAGLPVVACTRKESELKPAVLRCLRHSATGQVAVSKSLWQGAKVKSREALPPAFMRVLAGA